MAGLKQAYLAGEVCLTPNPQMYGLLADKARMALWSNPGHRDAFPLTEEDKVLLANVLPEAFLLHDEDRQWLWSERKRWVFKPTTHYGSKGVLLGDKTTHKRFDAFPENTTLVQERVPPSRIDVPDYGPMKADLRLFAYRDRVLGATARIYSGQVTNMRTPGGGFAPVALL